MSCMRDCIFRSSQESSPGMTTTNVRLLCPAIYGDAWQKGKSRRSGAAWRLLTSLFPQKNQNMMWHLSEEVDHLRLVQRLSGYR